MFLQGMPAARVLHNALGTPSAPQAAPAPITKTKTFQKAKSLLSFRHQGSTAASFGSNRSSMLPAAYPALPPGDPYQHLVLKLAYLCRHWGCESSIAGVASDCFCLRSPVVILCLMCKGSVWPLSVGLGKPFLVCL